MDYILSGVPSEVEKVIRENRIRVERGVIKFTPAPSAEVSEEDPVVADTKEAPDNDTKDVPQTDTKEAVSPKAKRTKKAQ